MGEADINARFDAVDVPRGTMAAVVLDACRRAAHEIGARSPQDDDLGVLQVVQYLELAAHTGGRLLSSVHPAPDEEDPVKDNPQAPEPDEIEPMPDR